MDQRFVGLFWKGFCFVGVSASEVCFPSPARPDPIKKAVNISGWMLMVWSTLTYINVGLSLSRRLSLLDGD